MFFNSDSRKSSAYIHIYIYIHTYIFYYCLLRPLQFCFIEGTRCYSFLSYDLRSNLFLNKLLILIMMIECKAFCLWKLERYMQVLKSREVSSPSIMRKPCGASTQGVLSLEPNLELISNSVHHFFKTRI